LADPKEKQVKISEIREAHQALRDQMEKAKEQEA